MQKKLKVHGKSTSKIEVLTVSQWGVWLLVDDSEFYLPFLEYPWFQDASISEICTIELHHGKHLHWPVLDIDLELDSLKNPQAYPLTYKK